MRDSTRRAARSDHRHSCGDAGIRTPYLLRAKQALSQVSYIPALRGWCGGASWTRTRGLSLIRTAL